MKSKTTRILLILILISVIFYVLSSLVSIDFATSVIPGWHTTFVFIPNMILYIIAFLNSILLRIFFKIDRKARLWNVILLTIIPLFLYFNPLEIPQTRTHFLIDIGICVLIVTSILILIIDIVRNKENNY